MTGKIWLNAAIRRRGTSGTVRVLDQWAAALEPRFDVVEATPAWRTRSKSSLLNAARDSWWDFRGVGRSCKPGDVVLHPCNMGATGRRVASVVIVQDLMPFELPDLFDRKFGEYWRRLVPIAVRRADVVVTTSRYVAQQIDERWPGVNVETVYPPVDPPGGDGDTDGSAPLGSGPVRAVMIGVTEPHKNHVAAVHAVARARHLSGRDIHLRLIGPPGRAEKQVRDSMRQVDPSGSWSARLIDIPRDQLEAEFAAAWCLVQPSLSEGFGLPLLEACRRGLPVLHSGRGAMAEVMPSGDVGGDATEDFVPGLMQLLDPGEWQSQSRTARANVSRFALDRFEREATDLMARLLGESAVQS